MILQGQRLLITRLVIGLAQGILLYGLYRAQDAHAWPATSGLSFAPILLLCLAIPPLLIQALGQMEPRRALSWAGVAALVIAGLGIYDRWAAWPLNLASSAWPDALLPSPQLFIFGGGGLFIAHALVVGGHTDHRIQADYATHFDIAWKLAVQLALSALFVGLFWLLLWLGAGLFKLIKLDFFEKLLGHEWFSIPVIALAVSGALHLTDIRPVLVRGARTLLLTLLSWLLPLITLICAGFLASLPFTGLAALWSFGHASALLLVAAAALIVLINAAHQDGDAERMPPPILRYAGTLAALLPVPLVAIAAYALFLRVQQYGWTIDRITVAAILVTAGSYAFGYAQAALSKGPWLQRIEIWNFRVSLLALALLLALFTPIASPARIAVADQMARLKNGKVAPKAFDFAYLRWEGGRYGLAALQELAASPNPVIRLAAAEARDRKTRYARAEVPVALWSARLTVFPAGGALPKSFLDTKWDAEPKPVCTAADNARCYALLTDADGDGRQDILMFPQDAYQIQIFRQSETGAWRLEGFVNVPPACKTARAALLEGRLEFSPLPHPWRELKLGGMPFQIRDQAEQTCAAQTPIPPRN